MARVVVPGIPYHVTHRGNHRMEVFSSDVDRGHYQEELREAAGRHGMEIWAYCWMSNHVHLVAVPQAADSLARAIGRAHGRYSRWFNVQRKWTGHLWANRFFSCPLDGLHLWTAVRYVELNPVRAGLVMRAEDYPWSSARAHAWEEEDPLLSPSQPFPGAVKDWVDWLAAGLREDEINDLRIHTRTGRPLGSPGFLDHLEGVLNRILRPQKAGRKRKKEEK